MKRRLQEQEVLTPEIKSEYWHNFFNANEKRAQKFFGQLQADCSSLYIKKMHDVFDTAKSYFQEADLLKIHNTMKGISFALVCSTSFSHMQYQIKEKIYVNLSFSSVLYSSRKKLVNQKEVCRNWSISPVEFSPITLLIS